MANVGEHYRQILDRSFPIESGGCEAQSILVNSIPHPSGLRGNLVRKMSEKGEGAEFSSGKLLNQSFGRETLGGGGLQEEGIDRSKNLKASSLEVPGVTTEVEKVFHRYPEVQDYRKFLDRAFSVLEEGLMDARGRKEEVQEATHGSGPELMGNASGDGDRPSLAREGDSEVERRKREELERPRRFQEDEELYEENEHNQKEFARRMAATTHKNFMRESQCPAGCPAGCPDGAITTTTIRAEESPAQYAAFSPIVLSGSPRSKCLGDTARDWGSPRLSFLPRPRVRH